MKTDDCVTVEQARIISATLVSSIPADLSGTAALRWVHSRALLIKRIQQVLTDDGTREVNTVLDEWVSLYQEIFGIKKDLSALHIPERPATLTRLVVRIAEVSNTEALKACERLFPTNYHPIGDFGDDLNQVIVDEVRPSGDYAFWVRDMGESDIPPPSNIEHPPAPRITFIERLLLELKYFKETGEHLDMDKVTCCFGTYHKSERERPVLCWRNKKLEIFWQGDLYTDVLMGCSPYWSREMHL